MEMEEKECRGMSRRQMMIGTGALAASTALVQLGGNAAVGHGQGWSHREMAVAL